ncbi:MAG: hypothetical protein K2Q22_01850 [Cytophagales bacterium]|nr:hypothetical protein [Cytophagales bacterium]
MNWSEELKKDIYLYRFAALILLEIEFVKPSDRPHRDHELEENLGAFYKAILNQRTIQVNS